MDDIGKSTPRPAVRVCSLSGATETKISEEIETSVDFGESPGGRRQAPASSLRQRANQRRKRPAVAAGNPDQRMTKRAGRAKACGRSPERAAGMRARAPRGFRATSISSRIESSVARRQPRVRGLPTVSQLAPPCSAYSPEIGIFAIPSGPSGLGAARAAHRGSGPSARDSRRDRGRPARPGTRPSARDGRASRSRPGSRVQLPRCEVDDVDAVGLAVELEADPRIAVGSAGRGRSRGASSAIGPRNIARAMRGAALEGAPRARDREESGDRIRRSVSIRSTGMSIIACHVVRPSRRGKAFASRSLPRPESCVEPAPDPRLT